MQITPAIIRYREILQHLQIDSHTAAMLTLCEFLTPNGATPIHQEVKTEVAPVQTLQSVASNIFPLAETEETTTSLKWHMPGITIHIQGPESQQEVVE
jgi:hypothetical protein